MLGVSLSSCHRYHPAEVDRSCQSGFDLPCCLRPSPEGSTFGSELRGHLCVHLRYGPMTRRLPFGDDVGRLHRLDFSLPCYPSYKALITTLAGLSPAGHTSLSWTHRTFTAYILPVGLAHGITPLHSYYAPLRHPLTFRAFPGAAGYSAYLAPAISCRGETGFSSCSVCPCHRAIATTPPK